MPRNRKPSKLLELTGAYKKNPQRQRQDAEPAGELQGPPPHLTDKVLDCWHELAQAAPPGVITESDRFGLEIAACLLAEFRQAPADITAARLSRLESILSKFGMAPADRSRVIAHNPQSKGNAFSDL